MSFGERVDTWINRQASAACGDRATMFWDRIGRFIDRHRNYSEAEWAALLLREQLDDDAPVSATTGCCGCGSWLADVCTHPSDGYPRGESYCWKCVDGCRIDGYRVLPGRAR
jgi:hypothetical protein